MAQINFRIKIYPYNQRAVSFRGIYVEKDPNTGVYEVTQLGMRSVIRQYLRSLYKDLYKKTKFTFVYSKAKEILYVYYSNLTHNEEINLLDALKDLVKRDISYDFQGQKIRIFKEKAEILPIQDRRKKGSGKNSPAPNPTPNPTPTPTPAPTQMPNTGQNYTEGAAILSEKKFELYYGKKWRDEVDWSDEMDTMFERAISDEELSDLRGDIIIEIDDFLVNLKMTNFYFINKYKDLSKDDLKKLFTALGIVFQEFGDESIRNEMFAVNDIIAYRDGGMSAIQN
jgi:hypothetical protein